jgi:hypothetical protein
MAALRLKPVTLKEANAFVGALHRHHGVSQGHKFSIGATDAGVVRLLRAARNWFAATERRQRETMRSASTARNAYSTCRPK